MEMRFFGPYEAREFTADDWDELDRARRGGQRLWRHADGTIALGTYGAMAEHVAATTGEEEGWCEVTDPEDR